MKTFFALTSLCLALATPATFAQASPPVSGTSAAVDPRALSAANQLLDAMHYRSIADNMFEQMRRSMPAMMRQGAAAAINNNAKLDDAQKKAALVKVDSELPQALAAMDAVFSDTTMHDEIMQATAELYARHYTVDELQQIAAFYRTPVGAKMLATMPQLMAESMKAGQAIVAPRINAVMQKMQAKK